MDQKAKGTNLGGHDTVAARRQRRLLLFDAALNGLQPVYVWGSS